MNPLINGIAYGWSSVTVNILGRPVVGITSVSYSESQEMENNYGAGNRPISRGYGRITSEASITLDMTELQALREVAPNGRLADIPEFDIIVSYVPDSNRTVTHTIRNCRFMGDGVEVEEGAMNITQDMELIISHIEWQ
jgi:hypothetical protein